MANLDNKELLEESVKEQLNQTIFIKRMDVTSDESVTEVLQSIYNDEERIDVLGKHCIYLEVNELLMYVDCLRCQDPAIFLDNFRYINISP